MTSRSGGLMELVSRGKKDIFFTANPKISFFHSVYIRSVPFTKEIYITQPRNAPDWGRWVDFDIDHRGDLAKYFYLHIQLPTWLPPAAVAVNRTGIVTDASGVTFGYTNSIGLQVISKIQIFQDQVLIHENYGEYLTWRQRQKSETGTVFLNNDEVGSRYDTPLAIGRSATLPELRVSIPVIGAEQAFEPGIPLVALSQQRWRIRIHLRKLNEVVVASDGRLQPQPWGGKPLRIQATPDGPVDTTQVTLPLEAVQPILMTLESTQLYLPRDANLWLKAQTLRIPYTNVRHEEFTIEDNSFTAASPPYLATVQLPFTVDMIGSVSRMLVGLRSYASTLAGQRNVLNASDGSAFVTSLRLNISNIDRIKQWETAVFREVTSYWKNIRMGMDFAFPIPQEVYNITFGAFDTAQPAGTLQFTRAVLPVLYPILAPIPMDPRNKSRKTYLITYGDAWNVFEISGGKGRMMFDDT
uniref:Major capsid protein N-terminal domain-containing protein n=1 Tax=viral metagenome TaxID=1070528 RepID=A0A6C0LQW0_9ZZZZ